MAEGYEYGNARVRAMRSRLLDRDAYQRLLSVPEERLATALLDTPYRPDIETALPRFRGIRVVDEALRLHIARTLRLVRSFYEGHIVVQIDLLLHRFVVANIQTILRAQARQVSADAVIPLLLPVGGLDDAVLVELARQRDLPSCLDRMVAWRIPSARVAFALSQAYARNQNSADVAALEHTLHQLSAADTENALRDGTVPPELERLLRWEIDHRNLLTLLRLWEAHHHGELAQVPTASDSFLPGGKVHWQSLEFAVKQPGRVEAVSALLSEALDAASKAALDGWAAGDPVVSVAEAFDRGRTRWAVGGFTRGDPLGISVPMAYTFAQENEGRNLRLIAKGGGVRSNQTIRDKLFIW